MKEKKILMEMRSSLYAIASITATMVFLCWPVDAAKSQSHDTDKNIEYLKQLNFEDLLQMEVTSVSKKKEKLADAAAAVFVISSKDIERIGARSIPEALRIAPGLYVARISANKWAVSARGFGDVFSNKLLVLIDGRSVYTPLFSGVFWDLQDTVMEDIDRIEVIRGPGATLWGANAVNGVINIITKSAEETQGSLVSVGSGSRDHLITSARYGGKIREKGHFRFYVKGTVRDNYVTADGSDAHDAWKTLQSGFRTDMELSTSSRLTIQGDIAGGSEEVTYTFPGLLPPEEADVDVDFKQGNILTRWELEHNQDQVMSLQAYYFTKVDAKIPEENRHTFDLDFQNKWQMAPDQELIWGLGYRVTSDDIEENELVSFDPISRTDHLFSAFIQDQLMLVDDRLWLTLGSKFEHNDYSGFEIQPNIRLRFKPQDSQTLWAAVSRAVRTPSRIDHDLRSSLLGGADAFGNRFKTVVFGRDDFESEELIAYEAGYRWSPMETLSLDMALFYNDYDKLRSNDLGIPFIDVDEISPHLVIPIILGNGFSGTTHGLEIISTWQPLDIWQLALGYSYIKTSLDDQLDQNASPEHQIQLRSYLDLPNNISLDTELYYIDDLENRDIDAYFKLDFRLGWQVSDHTSLSLSVENLLDAEHQEFIPRETIIGSEVPRQFFITLKWEK